MARVDVIQLCLTRRNKQKEGQCMLLVPLAIMSKGRLSVRKGLNGGLTGRALWHRGIMTFVWGVIGCGSVLVARWQWIGETAVETAQPNIEY